MHLNNLLFRFRWLQVSTGMLILLLQRTPVLRVMVQMEGVLANNGTAIMRSVFAVAAMGAYNSVAGATVFNVTAAPVAATPTSGAVNSQFTLNEATGTALSVSVSVSGAPGNPKSWSMTGTLPAGLTMTGGNPVNVSAPYKMSITGTPTAAGASTVTVTAWSSAGASGDSGKITLNFNITGGTSNIAPSITAQPSSVTVTAGGAASFTVAASGTPTPTYQWQKGGADIPGATGATYTIASVVAGDAGSYAAVATNSAGSATSNAATLTVNTAATAPAITTQPASLSVTAGGQASFTLAASGSPTPTYQWQKGGVNIAGATNATYTIASVVAGDAGSYAAVATNSAGSATSNAATLTVNTAATAPAITTQPASLSVTAGGQASFTVAASGSPTPTYQWQKGGVNIAGATNATYTIASVVAGDAGNYTVVATNSAGSATSNAATLTVNTAATAPAITTQPASLSVTAGGQASFTVAASGSPTPIYQWQKGGVNIAGATNATYTIASVVAGDAGSYTAVATNSAGSATSNAATLTVNVAATAPTITTQPVGVSVAISGSATFTVAASGNPAPTFQWKKGGVNIAGATNATYSITSVVAGDAGSYTAVATNSAGSATSSAASLTVIAATAPTITTQPAAKTVTAGSPVSFSVVASGSPVPTYQWRKSGVNIAGATGATYTIASTVPGDAGNYSVVVTNSAGSATSNTARLTVNALPLISTQPQSQAAFVGATVTLTGAATGTPTPTYQWQKEGIAIAGATSATLSLGNIRLTDAGSYALIATNSAGSVSSRFGRVVVLMAQPNAITYATTAASTGVTVGGTVNLDYFMTNVGTKTWGANHFLSIRDANGTFVAFAALIGVLPGESKSVKLSFPAPATPGTFTYYVQALENGVEFFSTQTTLSLAVLARQPNSITYNSTTFPVKAAPGSALIFNYNVTNTGTKAWGANHYLVLRDGLGANQAFIPLNGIVAGQSRTVNLTLTAPTAPGSYSYTVQAMESGVEFFNTLANLSLVVLAPRPNAIVYTPTRFPDQVVPGAAVDLKYSLSNAGTQAWGAQHYLSLRDANGTYLSFAPLSGIPTGGSTTVDFGFSAPTAPGTYTYYVQGMENGVEFFSTQDVVNVTVVATPVPNAITYNATTFPGVVATGATVNFTYDVTNRGTKNWGTNHYLALRDTDGVFLAFPSLNGTAAGASKTASLSFVAPATPGIYTYRIEGFESGVEFFNMSDTLVLTVQ